MIEWYNNLDIITQSKVIVLSFTLGGLILSLVVLGFIKAVKYHRSI